MQTSKINVTSENIFPVIKKFLYSDHEIFLRELVSNAVDATQKLKALARKGDFAGDTGDLTVRVSIDKDAKTLTISDRGIGMTLEEVDRYINQIAFSSAGEFLEKYKDDVNAIIGHFGLGFYSSFMVSQRVEIHTRSWREGAKEVRWSCDGTPDVSMEEIDSDRGRGTDIMLHIDPEFENYLERSEIEKLLTKYCKFLPVEIAFGKKQEWKDGAYVDTDNDNIVNITEPAWVKAPSELKDEDYKTFYRTLYPMGDEPLFHIHLNVDYPFNLTGILFFPKIKSNLDIQKNKIQLYSNQVFVTDSVEGIVPEYLTLLHGVLDSPDIPLNVSRSYLQSDNNVKKISAHITKKVADRLQDIFKNDRKQFEEKWDNLKLFIEYGVLSDEKFAERAQGFALVKNTEGKYFTLEEYQKLVAPNQTDKNNKTVYLYTTDATAQYSHIAAAKEKGYDVLQLDGYLDMHFINKLERDMKDARFTRVDSEITDKLIEKETKTEMRLSEAERDRLTTVFRATLPENDDFVLVSFEAMDEKEMPIIITQQEFMRRMRDMSQHSGMNYYGEMPNSYNMVVNANHPLVKEVEERMNKTLGAEINNLDAKLEPLNNELNTLRDNNKDIKEEDTPTADKERMEQIEKEIADLEECRDNKLKAFGKDENLVKQMIDLALLSNNMLKGEDLNAFVKRSIELIHA